MCAAHTSILTQIRQLLPLISLIFQICQMTPTRAFLCLIRKGNIFSMVLSSCQSLHAVDNSRPAWQEWSLRRSDCGAVIHAHKRQAKGNACPGRAYSCGSAPRLDHVLPWFPRQHLHRKRHICPKRASLIHQP